VLLSEKAEDLLGGVSVEIADEIEGNVEYDPKATTERQLMARKYVYHR
jgi:hypothetical protein